MDFDTVEALHQLEELTRERPRTDGIPSALVPSVVHRARETWRALATAQRHPKFRRMPPTIHLMHGDGLEVLVERVVGQAVNDNARGVLEKLCG